jgi:hypothetical protein
MCFLLRQEFDSITEVTATEDGLYGARQMRLEVKGLETVNVVTGNWKEVRRGMGNIHEIHSLRQPSSHFERYDDIHH